MKCAANDCKFNVSGKCFDSANVTINDDLECEHFMAAKKHTCGTCRNRRSPICNHCFITNAKTLRCIPSKWESKDKSKK